ncbi:branched-chain amino acid ABC transporter permease [Chloroflexia bacterium SDU3-3]|nr:branched-chain amino acid ABC transporter permease [Chloroflexia bacterium SDU3-3]
MNLRTRAAVTGGIFGLLIALVSGGNVGYLAGIIAGTIAGILGTSEPAPKTPREGMQLGVLAGLVAGVLAAIGVALRTWIDVSTAVVGASAATLPMLLAGTLLLAGACGAAFGWVRGMPHPWDRNGLYIGIVALAIAFPFIDQALKLQFLNAIIPVLIFVLMALGLNIVVGYAGLLDLGYAAFFAIGAYTTGMLSSPHFGVNLPFWIVIWIAAAVAAIFGIILGSPTLPLRGDYLAIVTLGFGEIVPISVNNLDHFSLSILGQQIIPDIDLTGGPKGINPINRPSFFGYNFQAAEPIPWYFLILAILGISIFFILRLRNSRLGRSWAAMREDELAASAMGIDLVHTKLLAFAMGATFSGFAGAFYGAFISAIFPDAFRFDVSVMLLCMVILGGMGNINGVILGGLIIQFADRLFLPKFSELVQHLLQNSGNDVLKEIDFASNFRMMLFGLTLVIMMLVRPEGLIPSERRRRELHDDSPDLPQKQTSLYDTEAA